MDVFSVLGDFVRYLGDWLPRPRIVRATEGGVQFWFGSRVRVVKPGWRIDWPALADFEVVPVVRQVIQLEPQTLLTRDGKPVIAGAVVVYSIADVRKYLVENYDADDSLAEVAAHAVRDAVVSKTAEEIQVTDGRRSIDKALTAGARRALAEFGVEVETVRLTDLAPARVLSLVGLPAPQGSD